MIPLALALGVIFSLWTAADVVSLAVTGEDTIYHFASMMGWTGTIDAGGSIVIEWGMSAMDFLIGYWIFIAIFLAVVFFTFWASTRPMTPKTGKTGGRQ
jgi:hypothetical protein